jgi:hypothetical protein
MQSSTRCVQMPFIGREEGDQKCRRQSRPRSQVPCNNIPEGSCRVGWISRIILPNSLVTLGIGRFAVPSAILAAQLSLRMYIHLPREHRPRTDNEKRRDRGTESVPRTHRNLVGAPPDQKEQDNHPLRKQQRIRNAPARRSSGAGANTAMRKDLLQLPARPGRPAAAMTRCRRSRN